MPVGVIGVPDKLEGEIVHAYVALKPEADAVSEKELLDFAEEHLADYKLPEASRSSMNSLKVQREN